MPSADKLYGNIAEWNQLIIDLAVCSHEKQAPLGRQTQDYLESLDEEKMMKPTLFTYPDWNKSGTVFDFDNLEEDKVLVLCVRAQHNVPGHEHD